MPAKGNGPEAPTSGFMKDENGQWNILPWQPPELLKSIAKKNTAEKKKCTARKFIPIERLVMNPTDLDDSPKNSPKKRRIDKPVRKELFKVPQGKRKMESTFSINSCKSKKFGSGAVTKKRVSLTKKRYLPVNDGSPLLETNETEGVISKQDISENLQLPTVTVTDYTSLTGTTPRKIVLFEQMKTPLSEDSIKSQIEFVELEKTVAKMTEIHNNKIESPMTAVCSLLENTTINNSNRSKDELNMQIVDQIRALIKEDKDLHETYQRKHDINMRKIEELVNQLENEFCGDNKENRTRRSNRIASQITMTKENRKFVISPAISRSVDLRKTALKKNLTKNMQCEIQSPRSREALNMYNSFRTNCNVLCTPKLDRTNIDLPQASITRSLSRRIQKQCLLLQDTPKQDY